jgi:heme o synthase
MTSTTISQANLTNLILGRFKIYFELVKFRLTSLVAFSSGFGYILGAKEGFSWSVFFWLCIGGMLVSGAAITLNQIFEKDFDRLMKRTQNRPLPTGRISIYEAYIFAFFSAITGFILLIIFTNALTLMLSVASAILYSFVYTPLKRVGPISVFVGAIPGALPPLLGWTAATGYIGIEAMIIFSIQFIWQFPHFWAIAWVADEDYKKAGFKLLPSGGKKDMNTAINIMIYTLFLLPLGLLPAKFGVTGLNSAIIASICGILFLAQTFNLMKDHSRKSALRIMYGSFLYLPIVQIAYLLDINS